MTKREVASLFFKLMGVYLFAGSIGYFFPLFISFMNIRTYDLSTLIASFLQLIPISVFFVILFFLITKSDILSAKLIKNDGNFGLSLLIDKCDIMMIAFCCIGLSLLIKVIPNLISCFIESVTYIRTLNMFPNNIQDSYWSRIGIPRLISIIFNSVMGIYLFLYPRKVIGLWQKIKRDNKSISYQFGDAKSIDDLSLEDMQEYPIWILVSNKEQVGTFVKPLMNSHNVTNDLLEPIIGFRVEDTDFYGSADYDVENQKLINLTLWIDGKWAMIQDTADLVPPLTLVAIPKINGSDNVKYKYESFNNSEANLVTDG